MPPPAQPDYTALIAKATERLEASIAANSPMNAIGWLDLLERLAKAAAR